MTPDQAMKTVLNHAADKIEFRLANLSLDDPEFLATDYGRGFADGVAATAQGLRVPTGSPEG